jgi:hypothetical protein
MRGSCEYVQYGMVYNQPNVVFHLRSRAGWFPHIKRVPFHNTVRRIAVKKYLNIGCPTRYRTRLGGGPRLRVATIRRTTNTFLFISQATNVPLFKVRCNIFIGVRIIKEMPGSVASGTHGIRRRADQCTTGPGLSQGDPFRICRWRDCSNAHRWHQESAKHNVDLWMGNRRVLNNATPEVLPLCGWNKSTDVMGILYVSEIKPWLSHTGIRSRKPSALPGLRIVVEITSIAHEIDLKDLSLLQRIHFVHTYFLSRAGRAADIRRSTSDQFHSDMVAIEKCVLY